MVKCLVEKKGRSMIKKAMIMAAGVGSRLGVLSDFVPKPLVPLANIPNIDILLNHLSSFNIKDVISNTFYKAEDIQNHCKNNNFGVNFNYVRQNELTGTAGGLKACEFFLKNEYDFIVMSGDGLTDIDIEAAYHSHKSSNAIATIITKNVEQKEVSKYGIIVPDSNGFVKSFQEKPKINEAESNLANTGIYLFKQKIFDFIPQNTFYDFAKDVFVFLLDNNIGINTYNHNGYWSDIGSIEQYKQSNIDILDNKISTLNVKTINMQNGKFVKGENTIIDNNVIFIKNNVIGNNCEIGKNCIIKNSILWDNVKVNDSITIENSIVLPHSVLKSSVKDEIITQQHKEIFV